MRLIDADALIALVQDSTILGAGFKKAFTAIVNGEPTIEPEQRWIPCGKCIHADGKHRWCKVLDRTINEDYFCYWAEPWKEGEADES